MSIDPSIVDRVARLARLELSDEERQRFTRQLASILEYCATLNELDTDGVEPTSHVLALPNVFRDDVPGPPLPRDAGLDSAPDPANGVFKVPPATEPEKPS